jgi:hypothetical protein
MIRFAWDREYRKARRAGVPYRVVGRGWGWLYVGPVMIGRWSPSWLGLLRRWRRRL